LPGDEVRFRAWLDDGCELGGRADLAIEVVDNGPGLPTAVSAALTPPAITDLQDSPRGLGIYVIRDLVQGLRGQVVAAPNPHGSRIIVTLPIGLATKQQTIT
jgi:nitrogen-specific signal transduction histidine kinase